MKIKAIVLILLVSLAGCVKITNPFKNRSGEYLKCQEHAALTVENNLQVKSKSPSYVITNGEAASVSCESLTEPPRV